MLKSMSYLLMVAGFGILLLADSPVLFDFGWGIAGVGVAIHFYRFFKGELYRR